VPHVGVHRRRTNADEHLIVPDLRPLDLTQFQDVG